MDAFIKNPQWLWEVQVDMMKLKPREVELHLILIANEWTRDEP
jgi:hypothetical protein